MEVRGFLHDDTINCPCCGKRVPLSQVKGLNPPGYIRLGVTKRHVILRCKVCGSILKVERR